MCLQNTSAKGKNIINRCQTQRRIPKKSSRNLAISDESKTKKNKKLKSLSAKNYLSKSTNQEKLKQNKRITSDCVMIWNKQIRNQYSRLQKEGFQKKQIQFLINCPNLTQIKLKFKKTNQIQSHRNKITKIKLQPRFYIQKFEPINSKLKKKQNLIQKGQDFNKNRKLISVHLESTNFEDQKINQLVVNQKSETNKKRFSLIKMLDIKKEDQDSRSQKRKKIKSCKFVANPFDWPRSKFPRKVQAEHFIIQADQKSNKQLASQILFEEISRIDHLSESQQSQIEGICRQIMEIGKVGI